MDGSSVLTPQEVAETLKIAKNTVYELIKRGELNAYRVGKKLRIDIKDVEAYKNKTKNNKNLNLNTNNSISNAPFELNSKEYPKSFEYKTAHKDFVICGQDIMLDILSRYLEHHPNGTHALRSYVGSYNGLFELYQGNVQLATAHLWDGDTGEYNVSYVRRMLPGVPALIIHLAWRMQGFYVLKGNPKNITNWDDLKRSDISIINREKGSGTRILLDEHLRKLGIPSQNIQGYSRECFSHLAAASAVAREGADLAIGNEKAALQVQGVDFIPLQKERYALIIKKEDAFKPEFKAVLEILRSQEFKMELQGIGGYEIDDIGTITAET